jgi:predicted nucleic acid-binding protein
MRGGREFVLDASVAASWAFRDERSPYSKAVAGGLTRDSAVVPAIWALEVSNALFQGERRGRIERAEVARFLDLIQELPIAPEPAGRREAFQSTLPAARRSGLSVYDAAYLDLAARTGLPLATLASRSAAPPSSPPWR